MSHVPLECHTFVPISVNRPISVLDKRWTHLSGFASNTLALSNFLLEGSTKRVCFLGCSKEAPKSNFFSSPFTCLTWLECFRASKRASMAFNEVRPLWSYFPVSGRRIEERLISSSDSWDGLFESAVLGDLLAALLDNLFKAAASSNGLAFLDTGETPRGDGERPREGGEPDILDSVGVCCETLIISSFAGDFLANSLANSLAFSWL